MKKENSKKPLWKILYFIGLWIWIYATILSGSTFNIGAIWNYMVYTAVILAISSVLVRKTIKQSYIKGMFLVLLMFLFVFAIYSNHRMLHTFVFMLCAFNIDFKEIIKVYVNAVGSCTFIIVFSSLIGVIDNISGIRHLENVRFLGFSMAIAPILFVFWVMFFISYKGDNMRWTHAIAIIIVNFWLFYESRVNAPFFCVFMVVFFWMLIKYNKLHINTKLKKLSIWVPTICYAFSLIISVIYNEQNVIMKKVNIVLNNRWQLQKNAILKYDISIFGQNIQWENTWAWDTEFLYVDSAYLKYTLMNGLGFMLVFILLITLIVRSINRMNNDYYLVMFMIMLLYSIFNPQLMYLEYNPYLLMSVGSASGWITAKRSQQYSDEIFKKTDKKNEQKIASN